MTEKEILYSISTLWEWNGEDNSKIKNSCREIGRKYNIDIEYLTEEQIFEMKGSTYDQLDRARDILLKLLHSKSSTATPTLVVPYYFRGNEERPERVELGLPPPLPDEDEKIPLMVDEDVEGLEGIFKFSTPNIGGVLGWNRRESFLPCDYWRDICIECKVTGDVVEDRNRIEITGGRKADVEEAKRRLKQLEMNFLQRRYSAKRIPLVHYPNAKSLFKLYFCPLQKHPYFSKAVLINDPEDVYVLVAATIDSVTQKYVLPREISESNLNRDSYQEDTNQWHRDSPPNTNQWHNSNPQTTNQWHRDPQDTDQYGRMKAKQQENNIETEIATKGKTNINNSNKSAYSDEFNWPSIPRPKEELWKSNVPDSKSLEAFPTLGSGTGKINQRSNRESYSERTSQSEYPPLTSRTIEERSNPSEEQRLARKEAKKQRLQKQSARYGNDFIIDDEPGLKQVVKNTITQKNPNKINLSGTLTPGKMVRNYNFDKMKVLNEGFDYARAQKGEIRFYGSLGKAFFTKVDKKVRSSMWEFTDLKDVLVSGHGVKPGFHEVATYDDDLIQTLSEVLGQKPTNKSAYFEINADARNSPHSEYSNVYMYINMGYVSLEKVMLDWNPLVHIDWTVLDRKFDFSLILATRQSIRHDVKPFNTFKKKMSVSPTTRMISFENIVEYLKVNSINFKQVTRFKLNYPFIAELTRVEKLPLVEQTNSNKVLGKTGFGEPHYTIEIYNDLHREMFKQNTSIGRGEVVEWTVEEILGAEPKLDNLVDFVKVMLLLAERCHKAITEKEIEVKEEQERQERRKQESQK